MDYGRHHDSRENGDFLTRHEKARRSRALSGGLLSLLRKAFVETAVLAALSLASKFRFLGPAASAGGRRCSIERLRRGEDERLPAGLGPAAPPVRRAAPRLPSAPLGPPPHCPARSPRQDQANDRNAQRADRHGTASLEASHPDAPRDSLRSVLIGGRPYQPP